MIRVVLDTNCVISALIFGGKPRMILNQVIRKEILGGISDALSVEIKNVLSRRKFDVPREYVTAAMDSLHAVLERVVPEEQVDLIAGDQDDNAILECALTFQADCIITGDRHLLDIRRFRGIEIMTPSEFLKKNFINRHLRKHHPSRGGEH